MSNTEYPSGGVGRRADPVRAPGTFERRAWVLVFVDGFVFLLVDLWQFVTGPLDTTPAFSASPLLFQAHLTWAVGFSLVVMALAAVPLRRWEPWAWALLWVAPAVWLGEALLNLAAGGILWPVLLFAVGVGVLGLLLPARLFLRTERAG